MGRQVNDMTSMKDAAFGAPLVSFDGRDAGSTDADAWDNAVHNIHARSNQSGLLARFNGSTPVLPAKNAGRSAQLAGKRIFDIVCSVLAVVAFLPLFIIVGILIKATSKGPVFFRQSREGLHGKPFLAFKFRSMKLDDCDLSGVAQTKAGDPRITRIGRFIRRTSIDELPQLLNVLRGDMSLVGPRPHVDGMRAGGMAYKELVPYYSYRFEMLPGITGWAQANGLRGPTEHAEKARARIDHDVAYIQNFSLWLDLKILITTLRREFIGGTGN